MKSKSVFRVFSCQRNQQPQLKHYYILYIMVQPSKLKGHKSPVLALAHSSDIVSSVIYQRTKKKAKTKQPGQSTSSSLFLCHLLSGDETGSTRLWDLRCNTKRASHCIIAPNNGDERDVTAVGFHPLADIDNINSETESCPFTM